MITIKFLKDHRCFKKGEKIRLEGNTIVLVGDQGTGKSTLLELIGEAVCPRDGVTRERFQDVAKVTFDKKVVAFSHDYEKGNVRGGAAFGMGGIDDMGIELTMLHASHGQAALLATRYMFDKMHKAVKDTDKTGMLLLDEPDAGLSIRSAISLGRCLKHIGEQGHYIVTSIHSIVTMQVIGTKVFDVELRKLVEPDEFLKRMFES